MKPLEIWGGIECTLNRVGDHFINQCDKNGHSKRISDLTLINQLGIKKMRYPCLWELVAPHDLNHCDWSYLDERLSKLRDLKQDFIAGLLHHGSGPYYTSLIDPDFPEKFATYARLFATRYPWVSDYTPINEINTTSRFSLLYGHWYPHLKSEIQYLKSILLQCRGTILGMREIKIINPRARLIQTEDLGKCQGTEELKLQIEFENERRWLAWDLLSGKLTRYHPLYDWIVRSGISQRELEWFEENAYLPDVLGINHYQLSNRYLDHRLELFHKNSHGGNGHQAYADVGAIDTDLVKPVPPKTILREVWERYGIKMAITECHSRNHRESQMRWLSEIWNTCLELKEKGINIEAVTAWSMIGSYDWHNLCTQDDYFYEPGVFDLKNPMQIPTETSLAKMVRSLAEKGSYDSPLLKNEGGVKTDRKILHHISQSDLSKIYPPIDSPPLLILGATGTLGQAFGRICRLRKINYQLISRQEVDITHRESIDRAVKKYRPWGIINAAGHVRVEEAEDNKISCHNVNVKGAVNLALVCRHENLELVNFSSDLVFDGKSEISYSENDSPNPINTYGKSKAESEEMVLSLYPHSLMIRTSSFFGPWDEHNFVIKALRSLGRNDRIIVPHDRYITPTYVPDLVHETLNLLIDGERGIVHLTNVGEVSWAEFAHKAASQCGLSSQLDTSLIIGSNFSDIKMKAELPKRSSLISLKYNRLPTLENALERYFQELQVPIMDKQETDS